MNESTKKIKQELADKFIPIAESMRKEGLDNHDILKAFHNYLNLKKRAFYLKQRDFHGLPNIIHKEMKRLSDSKAELSLFVLLEENNVPFKFQYKIGPYVIDYLVDEEIVLELDGPHHKDQKDYDRRRDSYLRKMGYKVLRVPIWLAASNFKSVLETITELRQ